MSYRKSKQARAKEADRLAAQTKSRRDLLKLGGLAVLAVGFSVYGVKELGQNSPEVEGELELEGGSAARGNGRVEKVTPQLRAQWAQSLAVEIDNQINVLNQKIQNISSDIDLQLNGADSEEVTYTKLKGYHEFAQALQIIKGETLKNPQRVFTGYTLTTAIKDLRAGVNNRILSIDSEASLAGVLPPDPTGLSGINFEIGGMGFNILGSPVGSPHINTYNRVTAPRGMEPGK